MHKLSEMYLDALELYIVLLVLFFFFGLLSKNWWLHVQVRIQQISVKKIQRLFIHLKAYCKQESSVKNKTLKHHPGFTIKDFSR